MKPNANAHAQHHDSKWSEECRRGNTPMNAADPVAGGANRDVQYILRGVTSSQRRQVVKRKARR